MSVACQEIISPQIDNPIMVEIPYEESNTNKNVINPDLNVIASAQLFGVNNK